MALFDKQQGNEIYFMLIGYVNLKQNKLDFTWLTGRLE